MGDAPERLPAEDGAPARVDELAPGWGPLFESLTAIPFRPRPLMANPHYYWNVVKSAADFFSHNMPRYHEILVRANPYPKPFRSVAVPLEDGNTLKGWLGGGDGPGPAVVYVPGTFHTKDDTVRKYKAIKMWREWGFRVLAIDMRGFGESHAVWGTGGHLERRDVLDAARLLLDDGATSVAVVGESLGGAAALLAAGEPEAPDLLEGGVVAWSAYTDLARQVTYSVTNPGPHHPYYVPYNFFRFMLWQRTRGAFSRFDHFLAARADQIGLPLDELYLSGSATRAASRIRVPTLAFHARDDPIVPVEHGEIFAEAARENPFVRVRILDSGHHCFFDEADFDWYWSVQSRFLQTVAATGRAGPVGQGAAEGAGEAVG